MPKKQFYTAKEVANILGISTISVYKILKKYPEMKLGGKYLISKDALNTIKEAQEKIFREDILPRLL